MSADILNSIAIFALSAASIMQGVTIYRLTDRVRRLERLLRQGGDLGLDRLRDVGREIASLNERLDALQDGRISRRGLREETQRLFQVVATGHDGDTTAPGGVS